MNRFSFSNILLFALMISGVLAITANGQSSSYPAPRESRLLNGARILVWPDSKAAKVSVRVRIHSGAAFDQLGKEGTMQLLSDILFPAPTKEFFEEDLNGSFEVITNYDFIQINASGDADKFLTILETLSASITNPQINKESTERVRLALLERVKVLEKDPEYVAQRAAAKKLYGNYPYGRPNLGSSESLARIDFADLLAAEQRFFTADNATIAITGNAPADYAVRASKRLLGGWLKSDKKIPATFAQPNPPDEKPTQIAMAGIDRGYRVSAWMTAARKDKQFWASEILAGIWTEKYCLGRFEPHLLNGLSFVGKSFPLENSSEWPAIPRNLCGMFPVGADGKVAPPVISQAEFDVLKTVRIDRMKQKLSTPVGLADQWLDIETFKLVSLSDEIQRLNAVTAADVQRVQDSWIAQPAANVAVVKATEATQTN